MAVNLDRIAQRYSTSPHRIAGLAEGNLLGNYYFDLLCTIIGNEQDEADVEERKGHG